MLKPSEVETCFRPMLREHAGDDLNPDPKLAWDTFLEFARLPISSACQVLLFECNIFENGIGGHKLPAFDVHFARIYYIGGPHNVRSESAQLSFIYEAIPTMGQFKQETMTEYIRAKDISRTKKDPAWLKTVDTFVQEIGDLSALWMILQDHKPIRTIVYFEN